MIGKAKAVSGAEALITFAIGVFDICTFGLARIAICDVVTTANGIVLKRTNAAAVI